MVRVDLLSGQNIEGAVIISAEENAASAVVSTILWKIEIKGNSASNH